MKRIFKVLLTGSSLLYPVLIIVNFLWLHLSARFMVLGLAAVGALYFLAHSEEAWRRGFRSLQIWVMVSSIAGLVGVTVLTSDPKLLNYYPVFINLFLFGSFGFTWFKGPPMIYRLAVLRDKHLPDSPEHESILRYCTIMNHIWCVFFIQNALFSAATAVWGNQMVWSVYNGGVSYVLIGALLGGEFLYRKVKLGR